MQRWPRSNKLQPCPFRDAPHAPHDFFWILLRWHPDSPLRQSPGFSPLQLAHTNAKHVPPCTSSTLWAATSFAKRMIVCKDKQVSREPHAPNPSMPMPHTTPPSHHVPSSHTCASKCLFDAWAKSPRPAPRPAMPSHALIDTQLQNGR